jgi:hypothetical protein
MKELHNVKLFLIILISLMKLWENFMKRSLEDEIKIITECSLIVY